MFGCGVWVIGVGPWIYIGGFFFLVVLMVGEGGVDGFLDRKSVV